MIILGIDPGLNITGYGVIEASDRNHTKLKEAGVIRTDRQDDISSRLSKIYKNITEIINDLQPEVLVLEKIYSHYDRPVAAILMGHARGVVCLAAGNCGIRLINYPSTKIKKAITGKGLASKFQVQSVVQNILKLRDTPKPVDITDALACALTFVNIELREQDYAACIK